MLGKKLSVVIVNYNVKHFIEQCLFSVLKASENLACEIFVVDNNSVDGSVELIKEKFPQVTLIENKINSGFSVANNQAIKRASGEYVLLLNPDTIVQEDTFTATCNFMDANPNAGGLGVKMLDGQGNFAPESKRGLPTPAVAFYKMIGVSKLFNQSKKFGKYHLTYLPENEINEIDVISGAFMLMRKSILDKIGLLDESFFMYGEDIDLSYRITQAGYKNYYFPKTQIIHYKGESTKRSSLNYVLIFYKAMALFNKKHFSGSHAFWFNFLIRLAIFMRAGLALMIRIIKNYFLPFVDFCLIIAGLLLVKYGYQHYADIAENMYSNNLIIVAFPLYSLAWIVMVYFSGGYDKPIKLIKILRGVVFGTIVILITYALLPEFLRFSRAIILLGTVGTLVSYLLTRVCFHIMKIKSFSLNATPTKRIAIIGELEECKRVNQLLKDTNANPVFVGFVGVQENENTNEQFVGGIHQITEIISIHQITEIIFCAKNMSSQFIINNMLTLVSSGVDFKIAPTESLSIIGSNSIDTAGDLYVIEVNSITKPQNKRNKRLLDVFVSFVLIILSPIIIWKQQHKFQFLKNVFNVLVGTYSWVGYGKYVDKLLPKIKPSILSPSYLLKGNVLDNPKVTLLHLRYAKDYSIEKDIRIIWECCFSLGN